jgi:hypothetical protein
VLKAGLAGDIENDPEVREVYLGDDFRGGAEDENDRRRLPGNSVCA